MGAVTPRGGSPTGSARIVALACVMTACAAAWADGDGPYALGDFSASVEAGDGACQLRLARGESVATYRLALPSPCALHLAADGSPRVVKRGDGLFFLIESSTPPSAGSLDCDTRIQAVRLDGFGADLAPVVERVAACPPMDWDDAVFLSQFPVK